MLTDLFKNNRYRAQIVFNYLRMVPTIFKSSEQKVRLILDKVH